MPPESTAPTTPPANTPPDGAAAAPVKGDKTDNPEKPAHPESNVKETVESILVAFILAFIFRAFIVEAFVIPTGSMAPTLLGAHMRFHCEDCGLVWDVNYSSGSSSDDINIPSTYELRGDPRSREFGSNLIPRPLHCPNCGFPVQTLPLQDPENTLTGPPVHYGDRILVLKYLYLFQDPQPWDVVVFKAPLPSTDQSKPQFADNYIKRLVGNPGESIVVLDGDIYVGPTGVGGPLSSPDRFKIRRKPWFVQEALWRNVYDNDYIPHLPNSSRPAESPWRQPWTEATPHSGWDLGEGGRSRVFTFKNASDGGELNFDQKANPDTNALTDHLAYDELDEQMGTWGRNPVRDLRLSLDYSRVSGDGPLELRLDKWDDSFTARVTRGHAALLRSRGGATPRCSRKPTSAT